MKEKYVIYDATSDSEILVKMTEEQAKAIDWFIDEFDMDFTIETVEYYETREI